MSAGYKLSAIAFATCFALAACNPAARTEAPADQSAAVGDAAKPADVGDCVETVVTLVGPRLEGVPDSGSGIEYANGMSQVSYDVLPGVAHSQVGDAVRLCVVSVPENCPPGDDRGRVYSGTNLRSNETWTAPDSQHMCGGA